MSSYQNQRVYFDIIMKKYNEYLELYKQFNDGSLAGATTFDDFYMRYTYLYRYADASKVGRPGY